MCADLGIILFYPVYLDLSRQFLRNLNADLSGRNTKDCSSFMVKITIVNTIYYVTIVIIKTM
jgi:hypothetical protein